MGEQDRVIRPDEADEEARKVHRTIWVGEGLLFRAKSVAQGAEERHRGVTGRPLPQADELAESSGGHHAR